MKNDQLYGFLTVCGVCHEGVFAHGMFRHMKSHGVTVRFNCQAKCSECKRFTKTNGYPQHLCQSCWKPE